jgi:hypothetical protein
MSDVLNRDTLEYRRSANTPEHVDPPWLEVPRGSANETLLLSVPTRYLVLTGDTLSEMDASAKAAVDAAALTAARDNLVERLQQQEDVLRAFMLIVLDELNAHAQAVTGILDAIDNASNLAGVKADVALIADVPQRTEQQLRTSIRNRLGT